jgi:gliding motility-associated-like protein
MKHFYACLKKNYVLFFLLTAIFQSNIVKAQNACSTCSNVTSFTANLSSNPNNSYTVSSVRNGKCCFGTGSDACVVFYVTVHPSATEIKFFKSGGNNGFYQINCGGTQYTPTAPVCLNGLTQFCLTYCNPGNNNDTYTITTSAGFSATPNFSLRAGCSGTMSVSGLDPNSITWTSITGSVQGLYNSYLSCTSGSNCMTPIVTPTAATPSFIDYKVCGTKSGCSSGSVCDTVRVYTTPGLSVNITPTNPVVCSGGASTLALTSTVSGGAPPYTYTWSTGANTSSVGVGAGNYTVNVNDATAGCAAISKTIAVASAPTPTTPSISSNAPLCAGQTLNLSTPLTGGTYTWTGPNGFTSNLQNPSITNITLAGSGTYSVATTVGGCTSATGTLAIVVNPAPATPTASANSPLCALQTLSLNATTIAGATYSWSGPNGFTSSSQNPTIPNISASGSGTYSVFATAAGCPGPTGTVAVTVNPAPATPTAGANTPLCAGQTLSLTSSTIASATYNWTGPNSFSSSSQNPTLSNATTAASGTYSVSVTVAGCPGASGTVAVVVNPTPVAPTAGGNTPLCTGQTLSLTATSTGVTYSWSGPNGFSSTSQNPTLAGVTAAAAGTYSVNTTSLGCTSSNGTAAVVVNATPAAPVASSNGPLCAGSTLNLFATNTGATYSWTGPNSFSSTSQNPTLASVTTAASGIYSVTASASGCTSSIGTISVTVNPIPAAPTASNNSAICAGQTLSLTASPSGAAYSWTGPNGFTSTSQNPTIAGVTTAAAGTYSVTQTVLGCTSPAGTTAATINPIPATPTPNSNGPICAGQTLSLTGLPNGLTYSWTGPNGFTSTSQNPNIAAATTAASGTYSLVVNSLGCNSAAGTVAVVVNPTPVAPIAGGTNTLCAGGTINLTSTNPGGATFSWTGPNGFTSSSQNPSIAGASTLATGMYSVTVTVGGCTSLPGTHSVSVFGNPSAPTLTANTPVCSGQALNLGASSILGASYSWTGPNGFTSSVQNPTITNISVAANGTYSVGVSVSGCGSTAATIAVVVNATPAAPVASSNGPLCAGSTLNLFATNTGATYSWTGPNSFSSTSQNPTLASVTTAASGIYSVTASASGCTSSIGTISVTVNPIPAAPTASNNSAICAGQTLSLTASPSGAAYSWTGPNGFTSTSQNPTIAGVTTAAAGTYSVTQTVLGCTSPAGTTDATVNPTPAAPTASNNSAICAGQTLTLSASSGGTSYNWTGPNGFTSTSQNPTIAAVTIAANGTYSVTQTVLGCASPSGTTAVTINPTPNAPTAGGTATLCAGSTISLTSTNPGGATFNWSGPNGFAATSQNTTIVGASTLATGMYSVTATVAGCTSAPGTFSVSVFGNPSSPSLTANSPVCTGQALTLSASPILGASYVWSGPNGFTSSAQNPTITNITLAGNGTYSVGVNVSGCGSAAATIAVVVNPTPAAPTAVNNSAICEGSTLNFTANPSGGTYNWTGPNSFTSTSQNPSIAGASTLATGMYSVTITVNGCTSAAGTTSATVNPIPAAPTASGTASLCAGQTISLTASPNGATYSWTGPNGFTSNQQNPTITNASTLASGTYSVTQTLLGCTGPEGTFSVTVNPIPAAPGAGNNSPICALQTLSLTAGAGGTSYNWTGPNSFTSTTQDPTISPVTLAASGTYSVTQTILGCTSPPSTTSVTINPAAPTPTASSNSPICLNQTLNLTQTAIAGATYSWTGPNGFSSSSQNPSVTSTQTTATGIYSVFATVAGCPGQTSTISVLVSQPGTVTPGTSPTVCANNSTINLTGVSSTGSGIWSTSGTGTFSPNTINGNYLPGSSDISAGTVVFTLTSTNNGGCAAVTSTMSAFITPAPTASAGSNQTVCANNATVALNGAVSVASGGAWTSSGTGTFVPNNTALTASYVPSVADISAGSFTLTLTTTGNGNCVAVSNSMVISISPAPVVNPGTNPQFVCTNNPNYQLLGTSTTGSGMWASSGTGSFSNSNILNPIYFSSPADTVAGSITLTLTSTNNGGCLAVSQTVTLIYTSTLSVSAGNDQIVCSNTNVNLTGVSTTSAGVWSSSGTGVFSPAAGSLTTSYIPSAADISAGVVTLTLTSSNNGGCNPVQSVMNVTITPGPTANAGSSQTVCANNASVSLNGSVTVASGGAWSSSGTGTFSPNNTSMSAVYFASAADTTAGNVIITLLTTGNGSCSASSSTMIISFSPAPLVIAGSTVSVCKNNPVVVLNGYSSTGSGTWTTMGSGSLSSTSVLSPTYTPSTADTTAGSVNLVLTSSNNGGCNAVNDTVTVVFSSPPTVTAGITQTVCANNASVTLNGTSSTGSGTWTASGTGSFSPNTINGSYIPSNADITSGMITFTLTTTNNGGCNPVENTTTVNISPAPVAMAGTDQTVCANSGTVNLAGSFSISAGATWSTTGTGTFTPDNITMNTGYIPSTADTAAGSVMIFLTTTGNGNCLQVTDTVKITFIRSPYISAGSDLNLCPNSASPVLSGISTAGTGSWTTLGSGSFSPSNTVLNPTYIPSSADQSAGSVTLVLTSGTVTCGSGADTVVINFKPQPASAFTYTNRCLGTATSFTNAATTPTGNIVSWLWYFNSDTSTTKDPVYTFGSAGTQTVSLIVSNGFCTDSINRTIYINPLPSALFTHTVMCHDSVSFVQTASVSPGGISNWNWDFGDTQNSIIQNPLHVYADTGMYIVSLQVISDSGCVNNVSDSVHVTSCTSDITTIIGEPAVPSGFTPNGDGSNDVLFVKGGPYNNLDFRIFNEWGNQIFRSDIQSSGWDGTFKSAPQPVGRFIWTLTGELIDGRKVKMAGEVILNR